MIVGNSIVSEDIADCRFRCDIEKCKGRCCVIGDAGAPLTKEETGIIEGILPKIRPYMTEEGKDAVDKHGVYELDCTEEPCTTLVEGKECAFVVWEKGNALCAMEKAYRDGKIAFKKPISCHLYPLRIADYGEFISVNYHRWEVCCQCKALDESEKRLPLYQYLKEPLVRRFGEQWYNELVTEISQRNGK